MFTYSVTTTKYSPYLDTVTESTELFYGYHGAAGYIESAKRKAVDSGAYVEDGATEGHFVANRIGYGIKRPITEIMEVSIARL